MPNTMLQLEDAARYLHLTPQEVEKLVMRQEIPCEKSGSRPLFRRKELQAWASQRLLGFQARELETFHGLSSKKHHDLSASHAILPELVKPSHVTCELKAKTRASVLRAMVSLADSTKLLYLGEDLLRMLEERESLCSTAMSGGFALLHPRHHEPYMFEDSFIVAGRTNSPIGFGAPDGGCTDIFFLVCCQDEKTHLHVLARLCMMASRTPLLSRLRDAGNADAFCEAIHAAELSVIPPHKMPAKPR